MANLKAPVFVGIKLPTDVLEAARQRAEADDRKLSAYLRRIITEAVTKPNTRSDGDEDE